MFNPRRGSQIRIGVIGPGPIVDQALRMIASFPSFTPVPRVLVREEEAPDIAASIANEVEVMLLSDPISQRRVKERLGGGGIPILYTPVTDAGLYKALFFAYRSGRIPAEATAGNRITIDTLTQAMVNRALKDFDMPRSIAAVYDGPAYSSPDELIRFHRDKYESGESTVAFTGMASVAQSLTELGVPNVWLMPSDQDIVTLLERALLSTETRRVNESQIVVGIAGIDDFGEMAARMNSEHEVQKLKLDIHRTILDYVESLGGYLSHLGGDEYLFFTTRGIFERETGGYKTIPLAKEVKKAYRISLSVGIGFGRSANEAGTSARLALRKAKEAGGNACFIVREDGTLIGPLEMAEPVESVTSFTDSELIERAQQAGMTSAYLSKLLHHKARFGKSEYQVHELSALLDISIRSVHRLLLQWMDHGLVEIASMEKVPRGRPRQIYRFVCLEQ